MRTNALSSGRSGLGSLVFLFLLTPASAAEEIGEVRRGLVARAAEFRNARVRITYEDRARPAPFEPFRERVQVLEATFDDRERVRLEMVESDTNEAPAPDGAGSLPRVVRTSNEEGSRSLSIWEEGKRRHGTISQARGHTWAIQPWRLLHFNRYEPTTYLNWHGDDPIRLENKSIVLDGEEELDGVRTVRVAWEFAVPDMPGAARRGTYWIAPSLNDAILKAEEDVRLNPSDPWSLHTRIRWRDVVQVGSLWLPKRVEFVDYQLYGDGQYELFQELEATFEDWALNLDLDEAVFELEFPAETIVRDHIRDTTYMEGAINDERIRSQVSTSRRLVAEHSSAELDQTLRTTIRDTQRRKRVRTAATVAVGLLGAAAVVAGFFWARRTHK